MAYTVRVVPAPKYPRRVCVWHHRRFRYVAVGQVTTRFYLLSEQPAVPRNALTTSMSASVECTSNFEGTLQNAVRALQNIACMLPSHHEVQFDQDSAR